MDRRLKLQEILEKILGSDQVYFQPPDNLHMTYPAIVYSIDDISVYSADDLPYKKDKAYQIMIIYEDPDSEIVDKIADLPLCSYDRFYTAENLNHSVFTIYY